METCQITVVCLIEHFTCHRFNSAISETFQFTKNNSGTQGVPMFFSCCIRTVGNKIILDNFHFKVPLTPKNVFRLYKNSFSPDHHCEKIIVVAMFVNFLRIFKVYNFAHFHVHDRGIADSVCQYRIRSIEYSSLFNTIIPMKLDQKREKDKRSGLICAKRKSGSHYGEPSRISSILGSPLL